MTAWNDFTKKIFEEGRKKNPDYRFKDALKDASARKGEMGKAVAPGDTSSKKSRKSRRRKSKKTRSRKSRKSKKRR